MNIPLTIAGAIMVLTTGVHVFAGGPEYHDVYQTVLPTAHLASMAAVLWHVITINLIVFAGAYFWLAQHSSRPLMIALAAMQIGWIGLFLFYGTTMLGSLWPMPQWVIFSATVLLTIYGARQRDVALAT
ncbi:hypothetical protein [Yoonia sp. R2-816]|uniref:hypothetical protein n=1 Tax=Yoonia sp. R2-816 TaxID=3342638 RepID=UPI00372AC926